MGIMNNTPSRIDIFYGSLILCRIINVMTGSFYSLLGIIHIARIFPRLFNGFFDEIVGLFIAGSHALHFFNSVQNGSHTLDNIRYSIYDSQSYERGCVSMTAAENYLQFFKENVGKGPIDWSIAEFERCIAQFRELNLDNYMARTFDAGQLQAINWAPFEDALGALNRRHALGIELPKVTDKLTFLIHVFKVRFNERTR